MVRFLFIHTIVMQIMQVSQVMMQGKQYLLDIRICWIEIKLILQHKALVHILSIPTDFLRDYKIKLHHQIYLLNQLMHLVIEF